MFVEKNNQNRPLRGDYYGGPEPDDLPQRTEREKQHANEGIKGGKRRAKVLRDGRPDPNRSSAVRSRTAQQGITARRLRSRGGKKFLMFFWPSPLLFE